MIEKVLMLTSSSDIGGGPQHIYDLVNSISNEYIVFIACPSQGRFYEYFFNLVDGRVTVIPKRKFSLISLLFLVLFIYNNNISLLHSHGKGASLYGRLASLITSVPLVHTPHGIHIDQYNKFMKHVYKLYELLTNWIDKYNIFVSQSEFNVAFSYGIAKRNKAVIINNGIKDVEKSISNFLKLTKLKESLNIKNSDLVVISLSRFDFAKNMGELLKIAVLMPDVKFLMIGDGPEWSIIDSTVKQLKINNVLLTGFINNPLDYIAISDIYCSTSRWEGLPLSVLQAMSLSKPVVASNVAGNCDAVVHGKTGFLYQLGNINDAVNFISLLHTNEIYRSVFGSSGRLRQQNLFTLDKMSAETIQLYKKIYNTRSKI